MTDQAKMWEGDFGKAYLDRNPKSVKELNSLYEKDFGISRTDLNKEFLENVPKDARILEVGSGIGLQLKALEELGFTNLTGIEISKDAVEKSKALSERIYIREGSALDIPFWADFFDLVFTSGLLIHIHPNNLNKAIDEICRVSKSFVWGFEYYSDASQEVNYRGNDNMLWKNNFATAFLHRHNLNLVKERKVRYLNSPNVNSMFLLKKWRTYEQAITDENPQLAPNWNYRNVCSCGKSVGSNDTCKICLALKWGKGEARK